MLLKGAIEEGVEESGFAALRCAEDVAEEDVAFDSSWAVAALTCFGDFECRRGAFPV